MNQVIAVQPIGDVDRARVSTALSLSYKTQTDDVLAHLLATLFTNPYWFERQVAARKLGDMGDGEANAGLLEALTHDPFWKVRCAIIQSLERIGDVSCVPVLQVIADNDQSNIVRQYAAVAVQRLSIAG